MTQVPGISEPMQKVLDQENRIGQLAMQIVIVEALQSAGFLDAAILASQVKELKP